MDEKYFCPNCGWELEDGEDECSFCRRKINWDLLWKNKEYDNNEDGE